MHDFKVDSFKFLNYSMEELEKRKMAILLPFCMLTLRKRIENAKTSESRKLLFNELVDVVNNVLQTADRSLQLGMISHQDLIAIVDNTKMLYDQLYAKKYSDSKEGYGVVQEILEGHYERLYNAHEQAWQSKEQRTIQTLFKSNVGVDVIAKAVNMTVDEVESIIKKKEKQ
jgi:uncharacterized protein with NAD-binding domain and iron-sulfur cluster